MCGRVHPQFPSGSENRLSQQSKAPQFLQSLGEIDFLANEELLIKSTDGVEVLARGKEECARTQVIGKINRAKNLCEDSRPKRNHAARHDARTTAGIPRVESVQSRDNSIMYNMVVCRHII